MHSQVLVRRARALKALGRYEEAATDADLALQHVKVRMCTRLSVRFLCMGAADDHGPAGSS